MHDQSPGDIPTPSVAKPAWEVARDLRWSIARGLLLDPILWLGTLAVGWALGKMGVLPLWSLGLGFLTVATYLADSLLFRSMDTELLRTQPLGSDGVLRVRQAELGWLLQPLRAILLLVLAARVGWGFAGAGWLITHALPGPLLRLSVFLRLRGRSLSALWLLRPEDFERLSSEAVAASPKTRGRMWQLLQRALPLPTSLRSRVIRDVILLSRGRDLRGAFLLLLSPLSYLLLRDELEVLKRPELLSWRTLTCAALGGAAVAYAVGPGVHLLRNRVLSWERLNPRAGSQALRAALIYAFGFALLHALGTLATVHFAADGRFADQVPSLAGQVLVLEIAMAHFVVLFTMGASSGKKVHGEGTLVLALPIVAVGVAVAAWFSPGWAALYFLGTTGMAATASARYEQIEVSW